MAYANFTLTLISQDSFWPWWEILSHFNIVRSRGSRSHHTPINEWHRKQQIAGGFGSGVSILKILPLACVQLFMLPRPCPVWLVICKDIPSGRRRQSHCHVLFAFVFLVSVSLILVHYLLPWFLIKLHTCFLSHWLAFYVYLRPQFSHIHILFKVTNKTTNNVWILFSVQHIQN